MGLFTRGGDDSPRRRAEPTSLSIVAADLNVVGDLETKGVVKIEGRVQGLVAAAEQILVASGAVVEGDLHTAEAVVGGVVRGSIFAADRVELLPSAVVTGNITTARLHVHEGGALNGEIVMQAGGEAWPSRDGSEPAPDRDASELPELPLGPGGGAGAGQRGERASL